MVEDGTRKLPIRVASELRGKVCSILKNAKPPMDNVSRQQWRALKSLKELDDVVILPDDRGNVMVVMDEDQYEEKIRAYLETPVFRKMNTDPTGRIERKIMTELRELKRERELGKTALTRIRPAASTILKLYELSKIHKPDVPLRPNVSSIHSPTYNLVKYVTEVIWPLAGQISSFVKSSKHFGDHIKDGTVTDNEVMVSFDA